MSILSDTDLNKLVSFHEHEWQEEEEILIKNGSKKCFTPMSYDLRVGGFYRTLITAPHLVYLKDKPKFAQKVIINPGDIALIGTLEELKMPKNGRISGLIVSKVSQVSKGLSNVSTKVDPGWADGQLLVPIQNISKDTIELEYQEKFCTLIFINNQSSSSEVYSSSSRDKLVELFAQTQGNALRKEQIINFIVFPIVAIASGSLGYWIFKDSTGTLVMYTIGTSVYTFLWPTIRKFFE